MKKGIKNNSKNKQLSQNENIKQKSENPKTSSSEMNHSKPRSDNFESPLRSIPVPDISYNLTPTYSAQETKLHIIKLIDFDFSPKTIKITCKSSVRWIVCDNNTSNESIYSGEERKFVIIIDEIEIESQMLSKGQHFDHIFQYRGSYSIKTNYPRMKCTVEVYDDEEDLKTSLQMNYHERFKTSFMASKPPEKIIVQKEPNPQIEFKLKKSDIEDYKSLIKNLSIESKNKSNRSWSLNEDFADENEFIEHSEQQGNISLISYDDNYIPDIPDFLIQAEDDETNNLKLDKSITKNTDILELSADKSIDHETSENTSKLKIQQESESEFEKVNDSNLIITTDNDCSSHLINEVKSDLKNEIDVETKNQIENNLMKELSVRETDICQFFKKEINSSIHMIIPKEGYGKISMENLSRIGASKNNILNNKNEVMKRFLMNRYLFEDL